MKTQSHWQNVYDGKPPEEQSWYQPRPDLSLEWIMEVADEEQTRIVDVGGGASTLVDHLLARGGFDVTVVDIAPSALDAAKERLGELARHVEWVVADLTEPLDMPRSVDIWHDRAVFHFLTDENDRQIYLDNLNRHVADDGQAIIATFSTEGPEKCSGLPVRRYSPRMLSETLGEGWRLGDSRHESHETPWGGEQTFAYTRFERAT